LYIVPSWLVSLYSILCFAHATPTPWYSLLIDRVQMNQLAALVVRPRASTPKIETSPKTFLQRRRKAKAKPARPKPPNRSLRKRRKMRTSDAYVENTILTKRAAL
jgi:hypothetical protein